MTLVLVPTPLHSYTGGASRFEFRGRYLGEILAALDARFPGIRFRMVDEQGRIRPHIRFFVDAVGAESLAHPTADAREILIVCALSGG